MANLPDIYLNTSRGFEEYAYDEARAMLSTLGPLRTLTLVVGANNSGKSRLLRQIFSLPSPQCLSDEYPKIITQVLELVEGGNLPPHRKQEIEQLAPRIPATVWLALSGAAQHILKTGSNANVGISGTIPEWSQQYEKMQTILNSLAGPVGRRASPILRELAKLQGAQCQAESPDEIVYIPVHRMLRTLFNEKGQRTDEDIIRSTIEHNYGLSTTPKRQVFTGLGLYDSFLRARLGHKAVRDQLDAFEVFLSETFFDSTPIELTPHFSDDPKKRSIRILIGDGQERDIHDLGDGISTLIAILFPAFVSPHRGWILIEEPELHLHPGFQRILFDTLLSNESLRERRLRFIVSTHSNHLLGLASRRPQDVSAIHLAKKGEKFSLRPLTGLLNPALQSLGVENSSILLANCSIWVEGPSDRLYVQCYLDAFCRAHSVTLKEDLDYAFFMYGGALIEKYLFSDGDGSSEEGGATDDDAHVKEIVVRALCSRVFLLCDKDDNEKKSQRHEAWEALAKRSSSFEFCTTAPGREIENTISSKILGKVIGKLRASVTEQMAEQVGRLPQARMHSDGIGRILCACGVKVPITAESGALSRSQDKMALATAVRDLEPAWEDLSQEAREIARRISTFCTGG